MVKQPNNLLFYFITIFIVSILFLLAFDSPLKIYKEFISSIATTTLPAKGITILFVGDIMLDRGVARHADKFGKDSLLIKVEEILKNNDAVIGNLEGTITDNASIAQVNNKILRFTFSPTFLNFLNKYHFTAVSLANNHALDFGNDGYDKTVENLDSVGIVSFGSPLNSTRVSNKIILKKKTICLVGYHDLYVNNEEKAVEEINKIKGECDYTVLFAHWGDEYIKTPNARQISLAHMFVDAGADLVIGAHPHVVQTHEIYKNKAIFYSLGNFIFDQDFSYNTTHGLMVRVEITEDKTKFNLIPTFVDRAEVSVDETQVEEIFELVH